MNSFSQLLYWLIAGSKGGANRAKILIALKSKPMNAHNLAKQLKIDFEPSRGKQIHSPKTGAEQLPYSLLSFPMGVLKLSNRG